MKFGKLTGLLLLIVLLTACTAEQTGPPAYVEPEETTAVHLAGKIRLAGCIGLPDSTEEGNGHPRRGGRGESGRNRRS